MDIDNKNLVIFVHGTAASDVSDTGSQWWQLESPFSNRLNPLLASSARTAPPFHWSGANSELARRNAGQALLQRLRQIDDSGQAYHLVGHSHGGSVIWHALTQSAAQGKILENLRSWCTVGTPFLTFAPRWPDPWRWATFAFVTAVAIAIFFGLTYDSSLRELADVVRLVWTEGSRWPLLGYLALLSIAVGLWIWTAARALLPTAACALLPIKLRVSALAAKWYGATWLGLWHPLDEPINSLAGTLGPAPRIAPRRQESLLFRAVPFLGLIWDRVLMRAADEFAWRQVTDRAQGADLANQSVQDVGRAPQPLEPGFESLPRAITDQLAASANEHSVGVVAKVRALLENAYDERNTETIVDRMGAVLTFQELIHTSYFDNPEMAKIIAAHIEAPSPIAGQPLSALVPGRVQSAPKRAEPGPPPRGALEFITAIALFVLPALGLWLSVATVTHAVVAPFTLAYQLAVMKDFVMQPRVLAAGNGSKVASLLIGLEAKGRIDEPLEILARIPHEEHLRQAAMRLAYAYGRAGRIEKVKELLADKSKKLREQDEMRIRLLAYIGHASFNSPVANASAIAVKDGDEFSGLLDPFLDRLSDTMKFTSIGKVDLAAIAIEYIGLSGDLKRSQKMLDFAADAAGGANETTCDLATAVAIGRASAAPATDLRALLAHCPDDDSKEALKRSVAFRLLTSRHVEAVYAFAANNEYPFKPPEIIEDFLFTAKSEDDLENKIKSALQDIVLSALTPEQIDQVRHEDSWASRLARNYLGPIAKLADWTREAGATALSDALLDVIAIQSARSTEPMESYLRSSLKALVAGGRGEAARQLSARYRDYVGSQPPKSGDERLRSLALMAQAASAMNDHNTVQSLCEEALTMTIASPSSGTSSAVLALTESGLTIDPALTRQLLNKALYYAYIEDGDLFRNANIKFATDDLIRANSIPQAVSVVGQIGDTDLALDAWLSVIKSKSFDQSGSYDLAELGSHADDVKKIFESDDSNPFEKSDE